MKFPRPRRTMVLGAAILAAALYIAGGVAVFAVQESLIFPATWMHDDVDATVPPTGVELVTLPSGTPMWLAGEHDRIVLMVHGNAEWVGYMEAGYRGPLDQQKFSFAAVEMRNVAGAPGPLTEQALTHDVVQAIDALVARGWPLSRIIVHGRSIGGGIASVAAAKRQPAGLVLESTFDSLAAVVVRKVPIYPSALLTTPLRSDRALTGLDLPVLQVHDIHDSVVTIRRARALRPHLMQPTVVETAYYSHGTPIVLTDEHAYDVWWRWLNRVVPPDDEPWQEPPATPSQVLHH